jgi:hypothetical protein
MEEERNRVSIVASAAPPSGNQFDGNPSNKANRKSEFEY